MFYQARDFVKTSNFIIISVIVTITSIFGGNVFAVKFCFEAGFFPFYFFYILNC